MNFSNEVPRGDKRLGGYVCLVASKFEANALGRTYCIWLLLRHLGVECRVVTGDGRSNLWAPLRNTDFAEHCEEYDVRSKPQRSVFASILRDADAIIVTKALPSSYGLVRKYGSRGTPVLVDVDDPDIEAETLWLGRRQMLRASTTRRFWQLLYLRERAKRETVIVSNPSLASIYGGVVIPHVRESVDAGAAHTSRAPVVAFVGTPKAHKGINSLRAAVADLSSRGYRLVITAKPPDDAQPWEEWIGETSLAEGLGRVASSDIVALPSFNEGYARGQLPVKLIDAMLFGRAIVASDIAPMRWALNGTGRLTAPGSADAIRRALMDLDDPKVREKLGSDARDRALTLFTVEVVAPRLEKVLEALLAGQHMVGS